MDAVASEGAKNGTERRCLHCDALIASTSRPDRVYCSARCRQAAYERRRGIAGSAVLDSGRHGDGRRLRSVPEPPKLSETLEELLDVERLVRVLVDHAYSGQATSWRSALVLLERLYPLRWDPARGTPKP
jgi:hypothetical protein